MALAPTVQARLLKRFDPTEVSPGRTNVRVPLAPIPKMAGGRYGYLVGFFVQAVPLFTTTAATMTNPVPGRLVLGLLRNIRMRAVGAEIFRGDIDGRQLRDDMIARMGHLITPDPTDIPDADATDDDVIGVMQFAYLFGSLRPGRELDGAIPLVALDETLAALDSLRFDVGTAIPGSPAGVTFKGWSRFDVYALVRWEDEPVLSWFPHLRHLEVIEKQATIHSGQPTRQARAEYAIIRHLDEDTGGLSLTDYAGLQVECEGQVLLDEADNAVLTNISILQRFPRYPWSATGVAGAETAREPVDFWGQYIALVAARLEADSGDMAELPVSYRLITRSTHTSTRILIRERCAWSALEAEVIRARWGLPEGTRRDPSQGRFVGRLPEALTTKRLVV